MHTLNASMHIPKTRIITATLLHYHCRVHLIAACKLSIPMCLHNVCLPAGLLLSVRQNVCQGAAQDRYSQRVCLLPVSLLHNWGHDRAGGKYAVGLRAGLDDAPCLGLGLVCWHR